MKIAIDISQLAYPGSGVAVYTRELVTHLLMQRSNNEFLLFGSSLRKKQLLNEFWKHCLSYGANLDRCLLPFPQTMLAYLWNRFHALHIEAFTGPIDIFHSSDWIEPPTRSPKITTIHDLLVYKFAEFMHPSIVANQKRKLEWVKKESDRIIVDSESTKHDCIELLHLEENRLRVVHLGVSKKFQIQPHTIVQKILKKYRIEKKFLLAVGTLEPRKNIDRIIKAHSSMKKQSDIDLVVVGKWVWGEKLEFPNSVHMLSNIDVADLPALYTGASCFLYPSLYEGFGLPVLEAMACGCLVVTSSRGSLKEIAGDAAIIVDPQRVDSILYGIEKSLDMDEEDRKKMISKGLEWAKKFTWEKTAAATQKIYEEFK